MIFAASSCDPRLPTPLLAADWPGHQARARCEALYPAICPAAERYLDQIGSTNTGLLPQADPALYARFER